MTTFTKASVTLAAAQNMTLATVAHATEIGVCISVAVVDDSGIIKAFARMDGAPLVSVEVAKKKALTAVGFGLASGQPWVDMATSDPLLDRGLTSLPDFTYLPGGHPLVAEGQICGAVGVSGAHYSQDDVCAKAGLATLD